MSQQGGLLPGAHALRQMLTCYGDRQPSQGIDLCKPSRGRSPRLQPTVYMLSKKEDCKTSVTSDTRGCAARLRWYAADVEAAATEGASPLYARRFEAHLRCPDGGHISARPAANDHNILPSSR